MRLDSSKRLGCSGSDSSRLAGFDNHGQGASKIARLSPQTLRSGAERISMSRVETVEDPEDPRLIDYREIRDAERRRQSRTFIAEGREVVRRLLRTRRYVIRSALVTPPALAVLGPALAADGVHTYLVRQDIVKAIVGIEFHHGCLVVGERGTDAAPEAVLAEAAGKSLVVLEELGDASNVGAMFRNALAFGAGAVFLSPGTADPLYRKSIRVSAGAVAIGAHPRPRRAALLLGTEGRGLSAEALALADLHVRIPMTPEMDSLNVATAGAVALHWLGAGV